MNYAFDISDFEFRFLRDFLHERYGLFLKDDKISFVQLKLYPRITSLGLNSFTEYINLVKYGNSKHPELHKCLSLLTNNETYFFREKQQLVAFRDLVLPKLKADKLARGEKNLSIVSTGCSSGEEVYTLAMMIYETGGFFWEWDVRLIGADVSESALATARRGVYFAKSFRMTDPEAVEKYFIRRSADEYEVKENIRKMAEFRHGNLLGQELWDSIGWADVVFCRNVLIYFTEDKVRQALANFHKALVPGGYLFLGHSETLAGLNDNFARLKFPETIVYQKV